ncbi:unnamed protein product, partial [Ectocarpus sp. 8 AP-2014]
KTVDTAEASKTAARASIKLEINPPIVRDRRMSSGDNGVSNGSGSTTSTGAEAGGITVAIKTCESDMTGSDEEKHCTPRDTEVTGEEHELPYVDDVVPEVESTNQERQETEALPEMDDGEEKRGEDEHGEEKE